MVIPIGGGDGAGMAAPMIGPPPDRLLPRFKIIKVCLIVQIIGLIVQLGSGIPLQPSNTYNIVYNSLDVVIIIIVGIFLLKDDPTFAGAHACLVRTFCSGCADQCQGGVSCLCSWFIICFLTALLALLPLAGSQMDTFVAGFKVLFAPGTSDGTKWGFDTASLVWEVLFLVFFVSEVIVILAQLVGAWQGLKGFQEMTALQQEGMSGGMVPDDGWAAQRAPVAGGGNESSAQGAGDNSGGAGGTWNGRASQTNFQPFSGTGNRLGS